MKQLLVLMLEQGQLMRGAIDPTARLAQLIPDLHQLGIQAFAPGRRRLVLGHELAVRFTQLRQLGVETLAPRSQFLPLPLRTFRARRVFRRHRRHGLKLLRGIMPHAPKLPLRFLHGTPVTVCVCHANQRSVGLGSDCGVGIAGFTARGVVVTIGCINKFNHLVAVFFGKFAQCR
ncbi:MAG TPA: hypothetical protein VFJ87_09390 [Rhodanobacteraceae bacterium]|nr:hypothetical protein [Rhodanobacteraceae bacterium]